MATPRRIHRIRCANLQPLDGDDRLLLESMNYDDALGQPFRCVCRARSKDHNIDGIDLLSQSLTVQYEPVKGEKRFFSGLISNVSYLGVETGYSIYEITTRPWLWFLNHHTDCRIFQDKTVVEIVLEICKTTHGFTDLKTSLTASYVPREYCVQYQESDFSFISRLLEEEGIYYYVEHADARHTIVLVDDKASHQSFKNSASVPFRLPGDAPSKLKHLQSWRFQRQIDTSSVELSDYDFQKPQAALECKDDVNKKPPNQGFSHFHYPGRYRETKHGNRIARLRSQQYHAEHDRYFGAGNEPALATGKTFKMADHPRDDQNAVGYLITETSIHIVSSEIEIFSGGDNLFEVQLTAIKQTAQFRPQPRTPRPIIAGPQSATVVGKSGEEIWTDKYGRVKVQFPWDREGKRDEYSSCWMRVSTSWAGRGWGAIQIPRVGQEVLVSFLDGDVDRPVITGRVFNEVETVPYPLPEQLTKSGVKTRSTKKGTREQFNEFRFDDKKGEEEIYLHAEKDFKQVVENDCDVQIGLEKKSEGNQTIRIHNNRTMTLDQGDETVEITEGKRSVKIKGDDTLEIKTGSQTVKIEAGSQTVQAKQEIKLKVGASSITITPSSIKLESPTIAIQAGGQAKIGANVTQVSGAGILELSGGLIKLN